MKIYLKRNECTITNVQYSLQLECYKVDSGLISEVKEILRRCLRWLKWTDIRR